MTEMTSQGHFLRAGTLGRYGGVGTGVRDPPRAPTEDTLLRWDRSAGPGCPVLPSGPSICRWKEKKLLLEGPRMGVLSLRKEGVQS